MTNNPNNYENQKLRGLKRKYEYVVKRGGKCEHCGYNANLSALEFHHKNPEEKEFQIDIRAFSNHSLEKLNLINVNYYVLTVIKNITILLYLWIIFQG